MLKPLLAMTLAIPFVIAAATGPGQGTIVPPIAGLTVKNLHDTFNDARRQGARHEAIDILSPRGTPVRAVVSGTVRKLFLSKAGGKTIYLFDEQEDYCYYYAHLNGYRTGLEEGERVEAGEIIGYVGSTGNADERTPHLHMAIFELGPLKQWWKGTAINPYPILVSAVKRSTSSK